jgi:hypothetical protein
VAIDGHAVGSLDDVFHLLSQRPVDKALRLSVIRLKSLIEIEVTPAEEL